MTLNIIFIYLSHSRTKKGMWFDERLMWKRHVEYIEIKCREVLTLIRAVAGYDWGSDTAYNVCLCTRH
jgi:hypothetical protein